MTQAVIYEVRLEIDPEVEQEFDAWLAEHVAEMLGFEGFSSAEVLVPESGSNQDSPGPAREDPLQASTRSAEQEPTPTLPPQRRGSGRVVRQVQYHLAGRAELEHYFRDHADRMRQQGIDRFGDKFSASRAVYDLGGQPGPTCLNCSAALRGQYCEVCGQRDKHRIISLWELLRDLVGDVFEFDSRIWRSLYPLLFRPGRLTTEYLRGRRVHYTPPLRLYLISSLLFFLVVFFNADSEITFDKNIEAADLAEAAGDVAEAMAELNADEQDIAAVMAIMDKAGAAADSEATDLDTDAPPGTGTEPGSGSVSEFCKKKINVQGTRWDAALQKRATEVCLKLTSEGGATRFLRDLIDNAPGTMFFFLPVIAFVMALLYPLSRRYYVEHLLFFVHFHSFFFLLMTLTVLFWRLPPVLPGQGISLTLTTIAVSFYIPIYLFVAMRRVYRQSRAITAVKYTALGVAYFLSLLLSFTVMAFFTALAV